MLLKPCDTGNCILWSARKNLLEVEIVELFQITSYSKIFRLIVFVFQFLNVFRFQHRGNYLGRMHVFVNLHLHLFSVQRLSPATHFTDVVVVVRGHHYVVVFLRSLKILVLCCGSSLINISHPILK